MWKNPFNQNGKCHSLISHLRAVHLETYNAYEKLNNEKNTLDDIEEENNFDM